MFYKYNLRNEVKINGQFWFFNRDEKNWASSCSHDNGDFARFVLFVFLIYFEIGSLASHVVISLVYIPVARKKKNHECYSC